MIYKQHLMDLIERTLKEYDLWSESAVTLIYGTIAHESHRGTYLKQVSKNYKLRVHALGIAQMEWNTYKWMCDRFGEKYGFTESDFERMEYDLKFAILLCRLRYKAVPSALPESLDDLADYYKKYYNTIYGSASPEDFIKAYNKG